MLVDGAAVPGDKMAVDEEEMVPQDCHDSGPHQEDDQDIIRYGVRISLSIYLFIYLSIHPSIHQSSNRLFNNEIYW